MDFSGYIARRYLRSRRNSRFLSRGSVTAIVGITIGVAVLNITLAVMNGFHAEMQRTFVENMPMVTVATSRVEGFTNLGATMDTIGGVEDVTGVAPLIRQELIVTASRTAGPPRHQSAVAWGIDPNLITTILPLEQYLLPDPVILNSLSGGETPRVILGADMANMMYTAIGDTVVLTAPSGELDLSAMEAESRKFVVVGFFETGMYEFDSGFVYVDLAMARDFFGYDPAGAGLVGVRVDDMMQAGQVADRLEDVLGWQYHATDWMTMNQSLFEWINLEKIIMFVLLGMIILIAGFNIIGMLTMMVGERRREIGILLAMGARRREVMGIFLINGAWLGAVGVGIGTALGLLVVFLFAQFGFAVPGDVYFVETIPVQLQWLDVLLICSMTLLISLVAALWPSWEASNLKPMEIIRYT